MHVFFVPWAQLHCLVVCTGESLQWLPPHGPRNTSGHMVCLFGQTPSQQHSLINAAQRNHHQTAECCHNIVSRKVKKLSYDTAMHECIRTCVQPELVAMGYLYDELEVRPMVCWVPPWYDPLEDLRNNNKSNFTQDIKL